MLLIISNKTDLATDFLVLRLHEKNIPFIRLNTEDYLTLWEVDFLLDSTKTEAVINQKNNPAINVNEISGAYIRQPKLPTLNVVDSDIEFSKREVGETLKSLWRYISDHIWLNPPHNILRASNKPEQLSIAKDLGFLIPNTCITAEINTIKKFYFNNSKNIIAKAVKHGFLYDGKVAKVASTQAINDDSLEKLGRFARIPMIFQERIEKSYDIRVTVVGNKIFPTAIYSQEHKETEVDWRLSDHYKISLKHKAVDLPSDISNLCLEITKRFKLKYSAIDLIRDKNNSYYFLELNPNGQWAWIEQVAGHPIRDALIDELCR